MEGALKNVWLSSLRCGGEGRENDLFFFSSDGKFVRTNFFFAAKVKEFTESRMQPADEFSSSAERKTQLKWEEEEIQDQMRSPTFPEKKEAS